MTLRWCYLSCRVVHDSQGYYIETNDNSIEYSWSQRTIGLLELVISLKLPTGINLTIEERLKAITRLGKVPGIG